MNSTYQLKASRWLSLFLGLCLLVSGTMTSFADPAAQKALSKGLPKGVSLEKATIEQLSEALKEALKKESNSDKAAAILTEALSAPAVTDEGIVDGVAVLTLLDVAIEVNPGFLDAFTRAAMSASPTTAVEINSRRTEGGLAELSAPPLPPPPAAAAPGVLPQESPASDKEKKGKVTICHKGNTITVAAPALAAHLGHGDTLGPCEVTPAQNQ